jgi:hypothetical protein
MTLILTNEEVTAAISMGDCIEALEDGFVNKPRDAPSIKYAMISMYRWSNDRNVTRATNLKPWWASYRRSEWQHCE